MLMLPLSTITWYDRCHHFVQQSRDGAVCNIGFDLQKYFDPYNLIVFVDLGWVP